MPTENRSSNTDAPFQREYRYIVIKRSDLQKVPVNYRSALVDPMLSLLSHLPRRECLVIEADWPEFEPTWAAIEARVTGKPVEQHQVEPVPVLYYKALSGAECKPNGNAYSVYFVPMPGHQPLYAHADPGEVERLRAENEKLREVIKHSDSNIQRQSLRISNQSAQLAERDALLEEAWEYDIGTPLKRKIRTALSASAEPSAPSSCTWTYNDDSFAWDTTCKESFLLMEDGPKENCMKFCCYCSKPIIQAPHEAES